MRMLEATESITPGSCSASAMTCHIVSGLYLAAALCISAAISSSGNVLTRPPLVVWVVDVCSGESSSPEGGGVVSLGGGVSSDRKSTRLNSSHVRISYAVFCLKKKKTIEYIVTDS